MLENLRRRLKNVLENLSRIHTWLYRVRLIVLERAPVATNEIIQVYMYRACIRPLRKYASTVFYDSLPQYLNLILMKNDVRKEY